MPWWGIGQWPAKEICSVNDQPMHAERSSHSAHGHHAHGDSGGSLRLAAHATLHCLTGCVIGETIGLAIGVELGLRTGAPIMLATALSYVSGFTLGLLPVIRERGLSLW